MTWVNVQSGWRGPLQRPINSDVAIACTPTTDRLRSSIPAHDKRMTIFLSIAFCLSLAVILLGYWADRSAVTARINGANGLPILVALIVSAGGSLAVAVIAGVFRGWGMLGWVLLFAMLS
jgi:hypothetical protein